jgi:soluble lytic murein transglycosylase-like protein
VEDLHFGTRARRRAARKRKLRLVAVGAWLVSSLAIGIVRMPATGVTTADLWGRQGPSARQALGEEQDTVRVSKRRLKGIAADASIFHLRRASEHHKIGDDIVRAQKALTRERREWRQERRRRIQERRARRRAEREARERRKEAREEARAAAEQEQAAASTAGSYSGSIQDIIYAAAGEFGIEGGYLYSVAACESGLNPNASSPYGYYGLFQFDQQTWASYGYGSIYDPVAQARTAARLLAAGQASRWPNCA